MKISLLLAITFSSFILSAQKNATAILDRYYQVIGGQANIEQIATIYSYADCSGPNGKYQTELFSANGTKTFFRQIRENRPDYIGIVHGEIYWTKGNEVTLANKNIASMWRSHELQWLATHLNERFHEVKWEGIEEFAGKKAFKLSAIDDVNKTAYLFFDRATHLLMGFSILNPISENPETIQMTITAWEKVDAIMLPSRVTFKDIKGEYQLNFHTITINKNDAGVFDIPDKIMAIKKLQELHELQRTAHFNRDAPLLVSMMADDFIEISNGKITTPQKEDLVKRFQHYFDAVTFMEWDDITPPLIKLSDDLSMAHVFVNKKVKLKTNEQKEESSTFAWTSTYQKIDGHWLMTSITSTDAR